MQKYALFLILLLSSLTRLPAQHRAQPVDGFAAEVDGKIITVGDVIERVRPALAQLSREYKGAALAEKQSELFDDGLEKLVEQNLMIAQFNKMEAQLPASAVRERKDSIMRERFDNSEDTLMRALRKVGKTTQEWEDELREQMISQSMVQQFVRAKIHVSPREIREAYEEKKAELQQDTELKLRSISFRPAPKGGEQERLAKIQNTMRALAEGRDFAETAIEFSEGPKAEQGGDEGWINIDRLPEELKRALEDTEPGEITRLIETPVQTYIFKVEDRRGGETQTLAEAQPLLQREIEEEKYKEIYEVWMQGLYDQFQVRMFNPDISAVTGDL
ncbi:peptidyl-prolyl cis-trans isomerase [Kiritimatiellaeota bacterium B1221]|nr:peptidyl-prolyl cis-trans isomerase [Kiritimatiellaeota bacterium B1221]